MMKTFFIGLIFISSLANSQQPEDALMIDAFGKYQGGAYKDAVEAFNSLLTEKTKDEQKLKLFKGIAEYKLHNYSASIADLKPLTVIKSNPEADVWLARSYAAAGDKQNALLCIEQYLRQSQDPFIEEINNDSVFSILYNTNEWFDLWQKDWLSDTQKAIRDAAYYLHKQDYDQAHQVIENEIAKGGSASRLIAFNAKIYDQGGNTELALNEINKALSVEASNLSFLEERAGFLNSLGKFSDEVDDLTLVLARNPENFNARLKRAGAALNSKQLDLAKRDIQLYMKYFNSEDAIYLAGKISYASEEYLTALKYFNQLMNKQNPDVLYYRARGLTYYQTNLYDLAASDLSMSLDIEPNNAEANLYLGLAEYYKGQNKSACYYWKRAKNFGELKAIEYLQKYCNQ
jgi:Tfp pilus assembly protein PilF